MWNFISRQVACKTGKFGFLGAIGAWVGVATGHLDVDSAITITAVAGSSMFVRDKEAKRDQALRKIQR